MKTFFFFIFYTLVNSRKKSFSFERLRFFRLLDLPRRIAGKTRLNGRDLLYVDAASTFSSWQYIFDEECYYFETENPEPFILDLGANIGIATLYFKKRFPKASVFAYEPDPLIFEVLCKNVDSLDKVETVNRGIAGESFTGQFLSTLDDSGRVNTDAIQTGNEKPVELVTLSSILQKFRKVDFLKIDIEGMEVEAIKEADGLLNAVDRLFVEYHSFENCAQQLDDLLAVLKQNGFRYRLSSEEKVQHPFKIQSDESGMDGRVNVYAVKKRLLDTSS